MTALRLIGLLYVLPVAIPVWLFYLLPCWALGWIYLYGRNGWALQFRVTMRGPKWWHARWAGWAGHAMPGAIVIRQVTIGTVAHELRHVWQWYVLGPLFPIVYGVGMIACGYERNPLELDARRHES